MSKPYRQHQQNNLTIRTFECTVPASSLVWHRDREHRLIRVLEGQGWKFQLDNAVPQPLDQGSMVFVPAGVYHRLMLGHTRLVVEIAMCSPKNRRFD